MKKGQVFEGVVERYTFPNKGYVTIEEKRETPTGEEVTAREISIKGALKGQKVRFSIKKLRKGAGEGRLLEVLEKSPMEDKESDCPHFGLCGGCAYQTMSYENQLQLKEEQVKALLDSVVSDYKWEGIKGSPVQTAYRNKMEFSFGDEYKGGPLALGMHKKGGFHDIVTVDGCQIVDEDYNRILRTVLDFYEKKQVPFYKKMQHVGVLRHLVIRQAACSKDILVNLVTTTQEWRRLDMQTMEVRKQPARLDWVELAKGLYLDELKERLLSLELHGRIAGILHTCNDSLSDAVIPEKITLLYGQDYIYEKLLGLTFKISPFSFFQTNSKGAEVLYETARSYVGETKDKVIFDLYSGTGTIAQMLAPVAKKVIGVEIVEEAVEAARENAALNGLANCEFIAGDVLKVIDEIEDKPDIIVLDPPRDGIHPKALEKIIAYGVEEMVYISCKPTSLVRDLEILQARGYKVVKACAVDQFVGTLHVETCCLLVRECANDDEMVSIKVDLEGISLDQGKFEPDEKPTYGNIKKWIKEKYGFNVTNLYIGQIKDKVGMEKRKNYNIGSGEGRVPTCPQEKEEAIMEAFRHFGLI